MKINELHIGQSASIKGFEAGDKGYRHKLLAMGLTPGTTLQLLRVAPLGDPVELECRGFTLSLRQAEAEVLELEAS